MYWGERKLEEIINQMHFNMEILSWSFTNRTTSSVKA